MKTDAHYEAKIRVTEARQQARTTRTQTRWQRANVESILITVGCVVALMVAVFFALKVGLNEPTPEEMVSNCVKNIQSYARPDEFQERVQACELIRLEQQGE